MNLLSFHANHRQPCTTIVRVNVVKLNCATVRALSVYLQYSIVRFCSTPHLQSTHRTISTIQTSLSYHYIHYTHFPLVSLSSMRSFSVTVASSSCASQVYLLVRNRIGFMRILNSILSRECRCRHWIGEEIETIDDSKTENLEISVYFFIYYVYCVRSAICRRQMDFNMITNYSRKRTFVRTHNAINFNNKIGGKNK